jgi:2-oxoglutarate dehydrogenase E2 component (dihydrolipoamide succinyltransferase)
MTTSVEVLAPAEQTEGTRSQVLRWLKNIGESVEENEPLIEIETDKVTVEVASPGAGVLREILKGEQEEIVPGEVLGRIEAAGDEGVASAGGGAVGSGEVSPDGAGAMSDVGLARSSAQESGASGASAGGRDVAGASDALAAGGGAAVSRGFPTVVGHAAGLLSPAVRRLLNENSLDPATIRGTGQGGRITVEDVLARLASGGSAGAVGNAAAAGPAAISPAAGGTRSVPHTPVRKRIAEHMVQSLLHTAPHVTTVFEADMTAVLAHRRKHRDEFAKRGVPLTLTAYFLQAAVDAIRAVPEVNSKWTDSALELYDFIHIGVGTAVEDVGLVVPVLRDVQSRDLFSTAEGLNDLVTRAREGKLTPADVRGGTFTISNHGVSGSLVATPIIINQPQSAILGIGKLDKRLVVLEEGGEDRVAIRPRCYVTLTIDHRVMDGHRANLFLQTFVERLTSWS